MVSLGVVLLILVAGVAGKARVTYEVNDLAKWHETMTANNSELFSVSRYPATIVLNSELLLATELK